MNLKELSEKLNVANLEIYVRNPNGVTAYKVKSSDFAITIDNHNGRKVKGVLLLETDASSPIEVLTEESVNNFMGKNR